MATGRGAKPIAGISSYCVGNLRIPGYPLPWEEDWAYASNLASPLDIEVRRKFYCRGGEGMEGRAGGAWVTYCHSMAIDVAS